MSEDPEDDLKLLARLLCEEMGLGPDDVVGAGVLDIRTPPEREAFGNYIPDTLLSVPRWQTYRAEAYRLLAQRRALRRFDDEMDKRWKLAMEMSGMKSTITAVGDEPPAA